MILIFEKYILIFFFFFFFYITSSFHPRNFRMVRYFAMKNLLLIEILIYYNVSRRINNIIEYILNSIARVILNQFIYIFFVLLAQYIYLIINIIIIDFKIIM